MASCFTRNSGTPKLWMTSLLRSRTIDRLVHRQVQLIDRRDVVLRRRIVAIESQRVRLEVEQLDVGAAEHAVGAGVVDVPGELLAGDLHEQRLVLRRDVVDARGPERDREAEQQHRFDHGDADFEVGRRVRLDARCSPPPDCAIGGSGSGQ